MKNPFKSATARMKKRVATRKAAKERVKFIRATRLGGITAYIPQNRPSVVVFEFVGECYKGTPLEDSDPIVIDREQLRNFLILPGDIKRAQKEVKKIKKIKGQLGEAIENVERDGKTYKVRGVKHESKKGQ